MLFRATKALCSVLILAVIPCTFARACPVDVVVVKGQVEHAPGNAKVRVQLVYAKDVVGESAEATVEDGRFSIPIEFLTQSHRPVVNGILEKCARRPGTIILTLMGSNSNEERQYDRVSLNFAKDFKMADSSAYVLRIEVVLNASR